MSVDKTSVSVGGNVLTGMFLIMFAAKIFGETFDAPGKDYLSWWLVWAPIWAPMSILATFGILYVVIHLIRGK